MFLVRRPSADRVGRFLESQRGAPFSYREVGASRDCAQTGAPAGYRADRHRARIGQGQDAFGRAVGAIRHWQMFDTGWIELCRPTTPIEVGETVALLVRHFGFWSIHACRIVYTIEERGAGERFGFAYGTLAGHAEIGEERFTVELLPDQSVWYDICAFSRPRGLARIGFPLARSLQRRFARDSKEALRRAVLEG